MCGRTACTLAPDVICRACSYKDPSDGGGDSSKYKKPKWRDHPPSKDSTTSYAYYPSANIAPTRFTPVMVSSEKLNIKTEEGHEDPQEGSTDRDIMPMMFGLIPHYHKGEAKSHGLSTNNCRLEGLLESKLYKRSWNERKFCVILAQGFYEWKTVGASEKGKKQPYFIYMPQENSDPEKKVNLVVDGEIWQNAEWDEEKGWSGPNILKMAGLYDVWKSPTTGDDVYSYTIITMESNDTLSWLHHRMPAILDTEEKLNAWLNATPETPTDELLSILKPTNSLQWHPVDSKVGNSRCHDFDCMQPVDLNKKVTNTFMDKWLKRPAPVKVKAEEQAEEEAETKKLKK